MRKTSLLFFTVISGLLLLSSCNLIKPVEIKSISKVLLNVDDPRDAHISAILELHNPNNFELLIKDADIDVYIEDIYLGKLKIPDSLHLEKNNVVNSKFEVNIKTSSLLSIGMNVLSRIDEGYFELNLKGTFYSEFLWFKRNMKIDRKDRVQLN